MPSNQVTLTFAGDSGDLEKAFDKVGEAADEMADEVGQASKSIGRTSEAFDKVGEGSDVMERRARGLSDTIGGTQDTLEGWSSLMKGDVSGGLMQMGMGVADLAGGMGDLIAPLASQVSAWVSGHAAMAASTVSSAAASVGSWIAMGVQSLISAAQVAAAWLLSVWPIALVIAAVVGLAVLIWKNWDTIKEVISAGWHWVAKVSSDVWNGIKDFVGGAISAVKDTIQRQIDLVMGIMRAVKSGVTTALSGLADVITQPFRDAFGGIRSAWNSTIGGKGFSVPSWIPGIGGKSFTIPKLATGGIVTRPTIAMIGEAGPEAVIPLSSASGPAGRVVVEFRSSGNPMDDMIIEVVRRTVRSVGGTQVAFAA